MNRRSVVLCLSVTVAMIRPALLLGETTPLDQDRQSAQASCHAVAARCQMEGGSDVPLVTATNAAPAAPAFDEVSITINTSGERRSSMDFQHPDRFVAVNLGLASLISFAYKIPPGKLVGLPASIAAARFDIRANAGGRISTEEKIGMLRTLLADRFKLIIRPGTVEGPIYAMVMANSDGLPGPGLRPTSPDCVATIDARLQGLPGLQGLQDEASAPAASSASPVQPAPGDRPACGTSAGDLGGDYKVTGIELSRLALTLGSMMRETIVDRTSLGGRFDVDLRASTDGSGVHLASPIGHKGGATADDDPERPPSVFTALPEQLGLKLEPQIGPVEILIVDSIELPAPD